MALTFQPRASTSRKSRCLFNWRSARAELDAITGQSGAFARASLGGATVDATGRLSQPYPNGQPRWEWVDLDGDGIRETPGLLLEGPRTNAFTFPEALDNAAWTKTACSVSPNLAVGPDGVLAADKIVEDATNAGHFVARNTPAISNNVFQAFSARIKAAERTWAYLAAISKAGGTMRGYVNLSTGALGTVAGGLTLRVRPLANGWYRAAESFDATSGATTPSIRVGLTTGSGNSTHQGDGVSGIYADCLQYEVDAPFASSYKSFSSAQLAELLTYAFLAAPQAMTFYVRFTERGTSLTPNARVLQLGTAGSAAIYIYADASAHYVMSHDVGGSLSTSTGSVTPAIDDLVEIRGVVDSTGAVTIGISVNSGAETVAAAGVARAFAAAWNSQVLAINSDPAGGNVGFGLFEDVRIVPGVQTLAYMRTAF